MELIQIVPFLDSTILEALIENKKLIHMTPSYTTELAPFIRKETLTKLISKLVD